MEKIIIDTDPGIDDGMAIQLALNAPELEILGLTTVFGNASVDITTTNALRLLSIAKRTDIPVCKGASKPLVGKFKGGVPKVHGDDGQGNVRQPPSQLLPKAGVAHQFMATAIKAFPHKITIVAIGPLTNLARLLQENEGIAVLVKEVVIMGGNAFCSGNATPAAEANIWADTVAADIVFGAAWNVHMVGLDVTHKVFMSSDQLDRIAQYKSSLDAYIGSTFRFYRSFFKKVNKIDGIYVHDATAISYLLDRSLFQTEAYPIRVATANTIGFGKTWPSLGDADQEDGEALAPWRNRPRVNICLDVDANRVLQIIETRITSGMV